MVLIMILFILPLTAAESRVDVCLSPNSIAFVDFPNARVIPGSRRSKAYAYRLKAPQLFEKPLDLSFFGLSSPPQNFAYFDNVVKVLPKEWYDPSEDEEWLSYLKDEKE